MRASFRLGGARRLCLQGVAGSSFADTIKIVTISGKSPLTNVSIQAFLDRVVTYDNTRGRCKALTAVTPAALL